MALQIESYQKGEYRIFRILEDVGLSTDLYDLKNIIEQHLAAGGKNIAISFTQNSYLYTKSIAVLIACSETIKDAGGHLAIIEANSDILDILSVIDFDKVIKIFKTEVEIPVL
jgi:anti-anti-sigma factor